jgi:hypothetical protein
MIALMMGTVVNTKADGSDTNRRTSPVIEKTFQASINLFADDVVKFHVVKPAGEKVKLRVTGENGTVLYTYILKKETAARIGFDVSTLAPGKYNYIIEKNKEEVMRKTIEKR